VAVDGMRVHRLVRFNDESSLLATPMRGRHIVKQRHVEDWHLSRNALLEKVTEEICAIAAP
jgi:hypothetical protein